MKKVSIIVPLYKGEKFIDYWKHIVEKNLVLLKHSKWKVICELLFINDYPDRKINQVSVDYENIELGLSTRVVNSAFNRGIHGARVFGLENSSGTYIVFADQDDLITEDYLLSQLESIGDADAVLGNAYILRYYGKRKLYSSLKEQKEALSLHRILNVDNSIVSPGQVLMRREAIPRFWRENIIQNNGVDDYFLWICMFKTGYHFSINRNIIYTHVIHDSNSSSNHYTMKLSQKEMIEIILKNSFLPEEALGFLIRRVEAGLRTTRSNISEADIFEFWLLKIGQGKKTEDYFRKNKYTKIAIYGMSRIGGLLYMILQNTTTIIKYGIDKKADSFELAIPVYLPNSKELKKHINEVDAVIVTPLREMDQIGKELKEFGYHNVFTIKEMINDL